MVSTFERYSFNSAVNTSLSISRSKLEGAGGFAALEQLVRGDIEILRETAHGVAAAVKALDTRSQRQFAVDVRAEALWELCLPQLAPGSNEWRATPIVIKKS